MAANPSIQLGTDGNWAIKEDNLLAYKKDGTRFFNKEFDFTRGSLATFVDKDGLIKISGVTDTELVVNGDFATDSDWTLGTGITISNGKANFTGNANTFLTQSGVVSSGKTYKATFTVSNYVSGAIDINLGGSTRQGNVSANGTYTFNISVSSGNILYFQEDFSNGFVGSITNVSVKEIQLDVPRIDFTDDTTGHLLLEPQSTNKLTYSEDFSSWTTTSATLTSNQSSPDGFNNAYIIEDDSASSYERVDETITTTAAPHTFSVFIKKKTSSVSSYSGIQMGTGFSYVIFDSYNGTYNQQSNTNYNSIEVKSFNSEWWRLKLTATVTTSTRVALWGAISVNGTSISTAAIGSETFFGAQLEEKSYATSYIPTSGSTVTRNAEVCNNSGSAQDFSEEGVLYAEFATFSKSYNFPTIQLSDGTSNNGVRIFPIGLGTNNIQVQVDSGGSISFVSTSTTINPTEYNKIAVKFKQDDFSFYINGTQKSTDNSGNAPVGLNKLDFLNNFYGKVRNVQVFKRALSDTELQKLTTQ